MNVLITGAAGFVGSHIMKYYRSKGFVFGVDMLTSYYDRNMKIARLLEIGMKKNSDGDYADSRGIVYIADISTPRFLSILRERKWDLVLHLAAQPGVRESIENPIVSLDNNLRIFTLLLEGIKQEPPGAVLFASSSSVYSGRNTLPYCESEAILYPESIYGVMKRSMEEIAFLYNRMYGINVLGMRYFTVYGPMGRPDMAYYKFLIKILNNEVITIHNYGEMTRDYTYISDVVCATAKLAEYMLKQKNLFELVNIGTGVRYELKELIEVLATSAKKSIPRYKYKITQGENTHTLASTEKLLSMINYVPSTMLAHGVSEFVAWYEQNQLPGI